MAYPRFQRARAFKFATRTAGNVSVASVSMAAVDTALDIALEAQAGDVIEYGVNALWSNQAFDGLLDVRTMVAGSPVNSLGSGGSDLTGYVSGWYALGSNFASVSGSMFYAVTAGDIASGLVNLRLFARLGSAGTRTLFAGAFPTNNPLQVFARNLGPVDPN